MIKKNRSLISLIKNNLSIFVGVILYTNCYLLCLGLDIDIKYGLFICCLATIILFSFLLFIFSSIGNKIGGYSYSQITPIFPAIILCLVSLFLASPHDWFMGTMTFAGTSLMGFLGNIFFKKANIKEKTL